MVLLNDPGYLQDLVNGLTKAAGVVYQTVLAVVHVNYEVVSFVFTYCAWFLGILSNFVSNVFTICSQLLSSGFEFVAECARFVQGFFSLIWKFVILLFNVLDLLFRGIEQGIYFIISGGKWTANAIHVSYTNLTETGLALSDTIYTSMHNFAQMSSGAIVMVGTFSYKSIALVLSCLKYTIITTWVIIDTTMIGIADGIRCVTDNIYFSIKLKKNKEVI